ncbi:hypothetical protein EVAR_3410_1 [Eumeta japonica]|uniref:Uncharacterized protein n=1 Tax=Eumeta variegata TaxID=151549 RepID=A0A4C1ST09_EUMVA|nr:hypothetical protein EVAR_3410_1 [Eumeta japonica]
MSRGRWPYHSTRLFYSSDHVLQSTAFPDIVFPNYPKFETCRVRNAHRVHVSNFKRSAVTPSRRAGPRAAARPPPPDAN